jgi:hypothetical protein
MLGLASPRCRVSHSLTAICSSHSHVVPNCDLTQLAPAGAEASAVPASASMSAAKCVLVGIRVCVRRRLCRAEGSNGTLSAPRAWRPCYVPRSEAACTANVYRAFCAQSLPARAVDNRHATVSSTGLLGLRTRGPDRSAVLVHSYPRTIGVRSYLRQGIGGALIGLPNKWTTRRVAVDT